LVEGSKILHDKYDNINNISDSLHFGIATKYKYTLHQRSFKYDLKEYFFTNRVIALWNRLPDGVVDAKATLKTD